MIGKRNLRVIINGESVELSLPAICRLRGVVRIAAKVSRNTGVPWTRWLVYDRLGRRLDENTAIYDLPYDPNREWLTPEMTLYLSLAVGAGGSMDFEIAEAA